jgi:predicted nuclease of restriction endonuclease-like RecB superfamily
MTAINALQRALKHTETALSVLGADVATVRQELFALAARLPQGAREELEAFQALAETLEVLASEVTVREEHVPAGVS